MYVGASPDARPYLLHATNTSACYVVVRGPSLTRPGSRFPNLTALHLEGSGGGGCRASYDVLAIDIDTLRLQQYLKGASL